MHLEDGKVGFSSFILSSSFSWHFKSYYSGASRAPYPTLSKPRSWIALSWDELSHPTRGKKALYLWPSLDLFSISYLACCFCYRTISFLFDRIWFFFVSVDIISASCRPISYHVIVPIAFAALRSVEKPGLSLAHTIPRRGGSASWALPLCLDRGGRSNDPKKTYPCTTIAQPNGPNHVHSKGKVVKLECIYFILSSLIEYWWL